MARIAVAVSGGADSLFALISLNEQGHDVIALHGIFLPQASTKTIQDLQAQCTRLHIPLHVIDMRKQFDSLIIQSFIQSYAKGQTPNPCALCNTHIKFGLLMDAAFEHGAELFATGHYATKNPSSCQSPLSKGQDQTKEQSYFLSLVPKQRLEKAIFPLAKTKKTDNIQYLQGNNFAPPIITESQEICFVPEDAYRPFLQQEAKQRGITLPQGGPIFIKDGHKEIPMGEHRGLWQYTEGQRRGLGIAWSEPLYVCAKDNTRNALILGTAKNLALHGCVLSELNLFVQPMYWPQNIFARVRYRQKEAPAKALWKDDELSINFQLPQSPTACGQIAAIYDENGHILAGGIIKEVF